MWYLLLLCPLFATILGLVGRMRPVTEVDRRCAQADVQLDHELRAALIRAATAADPAMPTVATLPRQRRDARLAPMPPSVGPGLLAG